MCSSQWYWRFARLYEGIFTVSIVRVFNKYFPFFCSVTFYKSVAIFTLVNIFLHFLEKSVASFGIYLDRIEVRSGFRELKRMVASPIGCDNLSSCQEQKKHVAHSSRTKVTALSLGTWCDLINFYFCRSGRRKYIMYMLSTDTLSECEKLR